jgi:hypothetical protein
MQRRVTSFRAPPHGRNNIRRITCGFNCKLEDVIMGLDQKGDVVFRVSHNAKGQWDVSEAGFDKPLASFDSERDAMAYANDLAKTKAGSKVICE